MTMNTIPPSGLTPTGATAGTFGSATKIPVITLNTQGQITGVNEQQVSGYGSAAGTTTNLPDDTNLQTWADTLPASGIYDVNLTVAQGALPVGKYYIELKRHSGDSASTPFHTIKATLLNGASGVIYNNTRITASWGGWVLQANYAAVAAAFAAIGHTHAGLVTAVSGSTTVGGNTGTSLTGSISGTTLSLTLNCNCNCNCNCCGAN